MKKCNQCGELKEYIYFDKKNSATDGYDGKCKVCKKNNYLKDIEKRRKQKLESYYKNREYYIEKHKEWNQNNPDKIKKYAEDNKEKRKKYREDNRESINFYFKTRNTNDPEFRIKNKLRKSFLHSFRLKFVKKNNSLLTYTGLSLNVYLQYFLTNYPNEFNRTNNGEYHIDHIIPCSVYDFNNLEHIKLCWQPENLRLIPAKDNLSKNNKLDYTLIEKHNIWHLLPEHLQKERKL